MRNPGIDALRGLAILLVILVHLRIRIPLKDSFVADILPHWLVNALTDRGHEAVYVFFVISGFLITSHAMIRWRELHQMDALAFWARRAARILPCLLVLIAVLSVLHLLDVQGYTIWREGQSLSGAIVAALGFHINWYEGQHGYLPGSWDILWSLAIEEIFYLGFPIVCLLIRSRAAMMILLALFAASLPILKATVGGSEIWQQKAYLPGMSAISAGVVAALIAAKIQAVSMAQLRVLYAVGTAGLLAVMGLTDRIAALQYVLPLLLTVATVCLLLGFHWQAKLGALRSRPGAKWLGSMGRLSYEMYLSHMFVVLSVASVVKAARWDPYWGFVWYLPTILMAWGLGSLIERHLSTPSMKWVLRQAITNERLEPPRLRGPHDGKVSIDD
ncbi:acyltransferase family protein [Peristeroidobacter agariperforans]|uniref:acyltransferase family protein n=1 Tax=Peristeroidobacter agariperforans TaxID=268404 RepID=UPI00101CBB83|nr:acyltransferase [Peristeroidobacter agariperforans]